jgi:hypothetical protein
MLYFFRNDRLQWIARLFLEMGKALAEKGLP